MESPLPLVRLEQLVQKLFHINHSSAKMKKLIFLFLLAVFSSNLSFSQNDLGKDHYYIIRHHGAPYYSFSDEKGGKILVYELEMYSPANKGKTESMNYEYTLYYINKENKVYMKSSKSSKIKITPDEIEAFVKK